MKNRFLILLIITSLTSINAEIVFAQGKGVYNCERYVRNWKIPEWSTEKDDYISPILALDENFKDDGNSSLKLTVAFEGLDWAAGIVETEGYFDLTIYKAIACDIYLPDYAPKGIDARIAITAGKDWLWLEMKHAVAVSPGRRTRITANLRHGNHTWKNAQGVRALTDRLKAAVRKIAIRVESNIVRYNGPVYIDNIRLIK